MWRATPPLVRMERKKPPVNEELARAALASDALAKELARSATILADPPWRFDNRTGKGSPEHGRLHRYGTLSVEELSAMEVARAVGERAHLYLWVPNALLPEGLFVMESWGFAYKSQLIWEKVARDGSPDGRGMGFYFRNATETLLFGSRGGLRTLPAARRQVNIVRARRSEHSRKPEGIYDLIERCSPGPYLELFARQKADGWSAWGEETERYPSAAERERIAPSLGI